MRNVIFLFAVLVALAGCATKPGSSEAAPVIEERILVFGASGRSGRYLVEELQKQNRTFVGVTTNVERAREKLGDDITWVEADVRDPASVAAAVAGATHVISALGATEFKGPNGPEFVDWLGVKNVVDASLAANVQQMVLISASGVTDPNHILNKLGNVMVWKLQGEDYLRASGLPYTIVRPGGLLDKEPGQFEIVFRQGDDLPYTSKLSVTTRGDLARICIAALDVPQARNTTFEAFNDRDQPATVTDWVELFSSLTPDD